MMTEDDLVTYNMKNTDDYEELLEVPLTLATVKEVLTDFFQHVHPNPQHLHLLLTKNK